MNKSKDPFSFKPKGTIITDSPAIITTDVNVFVDVEQNTEEWMALRLKKIGSSSMGKIMANLVQNNNIEYDLSRFRFSRFSDGSTLKPGPSI